MAQAKQNTPMRNKLFKIGKQLTAMEKALVKRGWTEFENWDDSQIPTLFVYRTPFPLPNLPIQSLFFGAIEINDFAFTRKDGLIKCVNEKQFHFIKNYSDLQCPRSYTIESLRIPSDFLMDFKITMVTSFLRYILSNATQNTIFDGTGNVSPKSIDLAINCLTECILNDQNISDSINWAQWQPNYVSIVKNGEKFSEIKPDQLKDYMKRSEDILREFHKLNPESEWIDGHLNLWIIKPAGGMLGNGIEIMDDMTEISKYFKGKNSRHYIIQKYIERPLLIYKTKFDIRQYFLLTIDKYYFNVWIYDDCYLKFSSQEFNLTDLNRSIHITNHSVQKNYENGVRSELLPVENMWLLSSFKKFLTEILKLPENFWNCRIYRDMKKSIMGVILSAFSYMNFRLNSFHLYGCDFMVTENFKTYLIEINGTPSMEFSTSVTTDICSRVQVDLLKVIFDYPLNSQADTGGFKLLDRITYRPPNTENKNLIIYGNSI